MRRLIIAAATAVALLPGAARAQVSSGAPGAHARELAQAVVADEGVQARWSKVSASLEPILAGLIAKPLDVADPAKKERIGAVVHNDLQALGDEMIEARVSAMAQTFTVQELEGFLAFSRSPTGQTYRSAVSELSRELAPAFLSGAFPAVNTDVPEQKRALIDRILKAQDVAGSARKGWRMFNIAMTRALSAVSKSPASSAAPANDQAREDAFVKGYVEVEVQFYAKTFSDAQLAELAAYFDGPIGRALVEHRPQLAALAASTYPTLLERRFGHMEEASCAAVACSTSQRAALDARFGQFRSMMATTVNSLTR